MRTSNIVFLSLGTVAAFCLLVDQSLAQTTWRGPEQESDFQEGSFWTQEVPDETNFANFNGTAQVQISQPISLMGIQISKGSVKLSGELIRLGQGVANNFNAILVNKGSLLVENDLALTENKRLTLNREGTRLEIRGTLDTSESGVSQIGNLGPGQLIFSGNRTGGNNLLFRDGEIESTGILSPKKGGMTTVGDEGQLTSSRKDGPSIEIGSAGLRLDATGMFLLGAPNQIAGNLHMNGGTLVLNGHSNTNPVANLQVSADSVIDFSHSGAEKLVIGQAASDSWAGTLTIRGFGEGDQLIIGSGESSLLPEQLEKILFDGSKAKIQPDGSLSPSDG